MHLITRNVATALSRLSNLITEGTDLPVSKTESRVGNVVQVDEPMVITYTNPRERVLSHPVRDANPFFHLYESLWMLAGKNDVASLSYYSSKIADIASDDGVTFNGAYGKRWRYAVARNVKGTTTIDQIRQAVRHLSSCKNSRRCVIQMWDVEQDLLRVDDAFGTSSKDVCCNLSVVFQVKERGLDMTVYNRSNDLVLGALGANVVHFSFLQEYVASCLGIPVGYYHQISANLHVYVDKHDLRNFRHYMDCYVTLEAGRVATGPTVVPVNEYGPDGDRTEAHPVTFETYQFLAIENFVARFNSTERILDGCLAFNYQNPFLQSVARPMCAAFAYHKLRKYKKALEWCDKIVADDWRLEATRWIKKRQANWEDRNVYLETAKRQGDGEGNCVSHGTNQGTGTNPQNVKKEDKGEETSTD